MSREPAKYKPTASKRLKALFKKAKKAKFDGSMRDFVRTSEDKEVISLKDNWFHNKTANFSKETLGLGNTKKKKNK